MGGDRRADIQGLRGVAVLLVVAYHAHLRLPGGFIGVDVFFAISGFVITALLLRELGTSGSIDLGRFYGRRARRLLPALAVMVVVVEAAGLLAGPFATQRTGAHTGIAASVFAANFYLYRLKTGGYFELKATLDPLLHTWTLAVEEQFYLLFPAILLLTWRFARRRPRLWAGLAVASLSVASFGLAVALSGSGSSIDQRLAFYGSPTRAWEFGLGSLAAILLPQLERIPGRVCSLLGLSGLVLVGLGAYSINGTSDFPGVRTLLPVGGACALLVAGISQSSLAARLLAHRAIVWVGDRSYSWYLWHFPLIVFARALLPGQPVSVAAAALSLVPASLSYRYVENPIRLDPGWTGRRLGALVAACVALPIATCLGVVGMQRVLDRSNAVRLLNNDDRSYADIGCQSTVPLGARTGLRWAGCRWTVAHPRGQVVLVGDSNASQFTTPVARAANALRYDFTAAGLEGCPFISLRVTGNGISDRACERFDSESLNALVRLHPSLLIIANRDDQEISSQGNGLGPVTGGPVAYGADAKQSLWARGLAATLRRLSRAGIPVLLVRPDPPVPSAPAECAVVRVLLERCAGRISRTAARALLGPAFAAENQALRGAPSATPIDFENELCGPSQCSTFGKGRLLFRDTYHLTFNGALILTGAFRHAIGLLARPPSAN